MTSGRSSSNSRRSWKASSRSPRSTTRTCTGWPTSGECAGSGRPRSWNNAPTSASRGGATEGASNAGAITFHRINDNTTRLMLQLDFEPEGMVEQVGDKLGFVRRRAVGDLKRFKDFIEGRGAETGAWRGEVERPPSV